MKTAQSEETAVVFRVYPDGQVIALFPYDSEGRNWCGSYMHVGQHSGADYWQVICQSKPATPAQYADLQRELESAPYHYKLRVIKRAQRSKMYQ